MKYKYLLLLLLMLPFVSGCNDSDDVNGIFTGKVWKLTYITKKNEHKPYDFWGDKDKYEQSIKNYINKEGAYTIKFEGETTDNVISGKFSGTLLSHSEHCSMEQCSSFRACGTIAGRQRHNVPPVA